MKNHNSWLGKKVKVKIDRPLGSTHPDYSSNVYPLNYGYIPGTHSEADQEEIDAYILGIDESLKKFEGVVIAVVVRQNNKEIKLIVSDGRDFSTAEIEKNGAFSREISPA